LATALARITFPYLILTVVAVQLSAMLNARERFWAAAAPSFVRCSQGFEAPQKKKGPVSFPTRALPHSSGKDQCIVRTRT